jgi:hypothetical protein
VKRAVAASFVALAASGGCQQQPSFNDQYAQTEKRLQQRAAAIDAEMKMKLQAENSTGAIE